jgi:hypothetical protein
LSPGNTRVACGTVSQTTLIAAESTCEINSRVLHFEAVLRNTVGLHERVELVYVKLEARMGPFPGSLSAANGLVS